MLTSDEYVKIKTKYGSVCSWAIWADADIKPKSNISDMGIFDINKNLELLKTLHTDVVMVALNFSRECEFKEPFMNFHDSNPYGQDYKIRYAFKNTQYYGAYMTDIIKNYPKRDSKDVFNYLMENPDVVEEQLKIFEAELDFIKSEKPIILAFGKQAFEILKSGLCSSKYRNLIKITHYSHQIGKEKYREEVLSQIQENLNI